MESGPFNAFYEATAADLVNGAFTGEIIFKCFTPILRDSHSNPAAANRGEAALSSELTENHCFCPLCQRNLYTNPNLIENRAVDAAYK